jgi:formylmethanofuran dehydrogenase subunit E
MVRVALRYHEPGEEERDLTPAERRQRSLARMQTASDEELYNVTWVDAPLPGPARLFSTVRCSVCGEGVMEARAHLRDGLPVCPECYGPVYTRRG